MNDAASLSLLIVAHRKAIARELSDVLHRLGLDVLQVALTAEEGFQQADLQRPDAVIVDLALPGPLDGVETAARLVSQFGLPIVFLDSLPRVSARSALPVLPLPPAFPCLAPPFQADEVRAALHRALDALDAHALRDSRAPQLLAPLRPTEGVLTTDLRGRIAYLNTAAEDLTGWLLAEAVDRPYQQVFQLVDAAGLAVEHHPFERHAVEEARPVVTLVSKSGRKLPIRERTTSLTDRRGHLMGLAIIFHALATETSDEAPEREHRSPRFAGGAAFSRHRHAAAFLAREDPDEAGLRRSHNLAAILDGVSDPIVALDTEWRIAFVNRRAEAVLERPREEMAGEVFWDVARRSVHAKYRAACLEAASCGNVREFEVFDDEEDRWIDGCAYPHSEGLVVWLRDVTERKKAQEETRRMEKLESLGLLARGFAHDFNNLLTVLLGNLSLASVQAAGDPQGEDERALQAAKQATLQAQNLVQQLLTFAKGGTPIKEVVELKTVVGAFLDHRPRAPHINYLYQPEAAPQTVEIDESQFRRLMDNLLDNAEEAMPAGGTVTVKVGAFDPRETRVDQLPDLDPECPYVLIQVSDTGEGIAEDHLGKVFEPYFSTRLDAHATGLGLTVCESIARAHKGFLTIDSRLGSHTCVNLFLPALIQGPARPSERPLRTVQVRRHPARILVLEDEKPIRLLISMALQRDGLEVVTTAEGRETVDVYRQSMIEGNPFDLVIMDLSIPNGMGGAEAIRHLLRLDPDVAAIVSSGYSDDPVMSRHADYGFLAVLPKPYEPSDLRNLVASVLDNGVPSR